MRPMTAPADTCRHAHCICMRRRHPRAGLGLLDLSLGYTGWHCIHGATPVLAMNDKARSDCHGCLLLAVQDPLGLFYKKTDTSYPPMFSYLRWMHTRQTRTLRIFLPSSNLAASSSLGPVSDPAFSCFAWRTKARLMMTKTAEMCCKMAQMWRSRHRRLCSDAKLASVA